MKKLLDYVIATFLGVIIILTSFLLSLQVTFPLLTFLGVRSSVGNMFFPSFLDFFMVILITCFFAILIAMIGFNAFKHVSKRK